MITVRFTYIKLWKVAGGGATSSAPHPVPQPQTVQKQILTSNTTGILGGGQAIAHNDGTKGLNIYR